MDCTDTLDEVKFPGTAPFAIEPLAKLRGLEIFEIKGIPESIAQKLALVVTSNRSDIELPKTTYEVTRVKSRTAVNAYPANKKITTRTTRRYWEPTIDWAAVLVTDSTET